MQTSRRELLALAALWAEAVAAAQHQHAAPSNTQASYAHRFLTRSERETLVSVGSILIPADERSGGAAAARIDEYIDFVVSHGSADLQKRWREGLAMLGKIPSQSREGKLRELAVNEFSPKTRGEEFFVLLKGGVIEAFYTSEEGIKKELGYQGLGFVREFPGCTHGKHSVPEDYKPLLRTRS